MKYNQLNEIRAIKLKKANDKNVINMTIKDIINSKILINDSELLRIIKHFNEAETAGEYPYINQLISLKVGKNLKKYEKVKLNNGKLTINDCEFEINKDDLEKWNLKVLTSNEYIRLLTASGHTRCQKSMFVSTDLADKIDDIIRCGIPKDQEFDKISKWNAYYGLVSTDSKAVTTPNIVVIDDFEKEIEDIFDVVHQYEEKGIKKYRVEANVKKPIKIKPFDGAGLISVELAAQWREDINKTIPDNKPKLDYLPAAFQFRALPGVKGNVYTFDIKAFSKLYGDTIIDIKGIPHSISGENINCIITKSQFKFIGLYDTVEQWKDEFSKECYGYHRTFNISDYSEKLEDLKDYMLTAYQPLQTIDFTDQEIQRVCLPTINKIKKISTDVDEFLNYRGLVEDDDNPVDWSIVPPYYKALKINKSLFADEYIQKKINEDIKSIKNKALTAKLYVRGNYQVLSPDIYGLAQFAFKQPVTGLLGRNQIFSNYWNNQTYGKGKNNIDKVAIVRNPHIAHEWRIGNVTKSNVMTEWYKYQTTGIITSMYDTILLALNSADTDGDHIGTIFDSSILASIKRIKKDSKANTIDFVVDPLLGPVEGIKEKAKKPAIKTNDIKALMDVDRLGMSNDIGKVVDRVSILWAQEQTEEIQNYVKIMSIIASLTIDYAKTGEKADIPKEINQALKGKMKPYFMKFLPSQKNNKAKEECAIAEGNKYNKPENVIKKQERFSRTNCNVNRICWYLEEQLKDIDVKKPMDEFQFMTLLKDRVDIYGDLYKKVKSKLIELQESFSNYGQEFNIELSNSKDERKDSMAHYRYFYQYCRYELLSLCMLENKKRDKILDILINIYYTDADFIKEDKSILWNSFGNELIIRCSGGEIANDLEEDIIISRKEKAEAKVKSIRKKLTSKNEICLREFGDENKSFDITDEDIKMIRKLISKDKTDDRKLFLVFLILSRKLEDMKTRIVPLRDENGKLVKDDNKNKIMREESYYRTKPIQINIKAKKTINYSNLAKLAGIDRRKSVNIINELMVLGLLKMYDRNLHNPRWLVQFEHNEGKVLYHGSDIVKAAELVKKFR